MKLNTVLAPKDNSIVKVEFFDDTLIPTQWGELFNHTARIRNLSKARDVLHSEGPKSELFQQHAKALHLNDELVWSGMGIFEKSAAVLTETYNSNILSSIGDALAWGWKKIVEFIQWIYKQLKYLFTGADTANKIRKDAAVRMQAEEKKLEQEYKQSDRFYKDMEKDPAYNTMENVISYKDFIDRVLMLEQIYEYMNPIFKNKVNDVFLQLQDDLLHQLRKYDGKLITISIDKQIKIIPPITRTEYGPKLGWESLNTYNDAIDRYAKINKTLETLEVALMRVEKIAKQGTIKGLDSAQGAEFLQAVGFVTQLITQVLNMKGVLNREITKVQNEYLKNQKKKKDAIAGTEV